MRRFVLALVLLLFATSCATGRPSAVPRTASPELRERYAGKTLECAGKFRENVIYASIGAALASTTATSLSTSTATQATSLSNGVVLGLSCASAPWELRTPPSRPAAVAASTGGVDPPRSSVP